MWRLAGSTATWHDDQYRVALDLLHPERGLAEIVAQGQTFPDAALLQMHVAADGTNPALRLTDRYVRGSDLIATYADVGQNVRPEFCWRVLPAGEPALGAFMIETLISTQTDLLNSDPTIDIQSCLRAATCSLFSEPQVAAGETLTPLRIANSPHIDYAASGCAMLFDCDASPLTYAQLFDAVDVVRTSLSSDLANQTITATVSLFGGRFEKGVIRRTRMRGIWAPADHAERLLRVCWNDMRLAPLPLAT